MTESPKRRPSEADRPNLRIFDGHNIEPTRPGELSPAMRLTEFYAAHFRPVCRLAAGASPQTLRLDRITMGYWARLTGDPPLDEITDLTCAEFVEELARMPGIRPGQAVSPNTVRKHCGFLQSVIDRAGPRGRKNRSGKSLIDEPPYFARPRKRYKPATDNLSLAEIGRWLAACDRATSPRRMRAVRPVKFWRALVAFTYNTGLRIDTVMSIHWDMIEAEKWLVAPPEIFKGGDRGGRFYLNQHAREALESIRSWHHARIFPWRNWPASQSAMQAARRRLFAHAGIVRPGVGFHGLRKALITWVAVQNGMLAKMVAGHVTGDVTQECYVDPRVVAEVLERVPQPDWRPGDNPRQQRLF